MKYEEIYVGQIISYECEKYKVILKDDKTETIKAVKYTFQNPRYTFNKKDISNIVVAKIESNYIS